MTPQQQAYLNEYLTTLSPQQRESIPDTIAEYFCADEFNANECARLINEGTKRASCSLKQGYAIEQEPLPQVGRITVVLNWQQEPVCIIRLTEVSICPFDQVTEEFARSEGEGDLSYEWWRDAHIKFFTQYAGQIGAKFDLQSELVLERFEKVYPL
ncbi:ASCH domain-containing protein [Vibrio coralliilyticus OCN008]|uniref:ASCH domain-containing protein n=1 Tax=Vibrio coralliilyticus TaxID=190893 RepID=UPI000390E461|nr:ASCH domain-containing protein [Vibrio coralliilyticus]ERB65287.1 RNA-binding protein [Vibrio coralliilyticus OCN008]QIJ85208.1 ASCH domain-containing protein [Vibrio coralliilyticus OCN008]